ncbi:KH domain-containing protein [Vasconcelosia minhoensis]|uniref:KH domain-containing protein n=1 Tax=Vasconcelosia minhoensis TaxID=3366354 RepID=UPI002AD40EDA|nr:KH domain-containing protein [Romeria gracilis]
MTTPDFEALVRYLVEPFLDAPESLKVHFESLSGGKRIWIRLAFDESEDKGRVFGRGGRNIKAIRNVVMATGKLHDITANLNVYGEPTGGSQERGGQPRSSDRRSRPAYSPPKRRQQ